MQLHVWELRPTVIRGMENKITQSQTAQYIHKIGGLNFARWKIWHVFLAHLDRWPFVKPESQNYFKRREFLNPWEDSMLPPMDSTVHLHENKQYISIKIYWSTELKSGKICNTTHFQNLSANSFQSDADISTSIIIMIIGNKNMQKFFCVSMESKTLILQQ